MASNKSRDFLSTDDDIVQATWRHVEVPEQGTASGSWSWNNSI